MNTFLARLISPCSLIRGRSCLCLELAFVASIGFQVLEYMFGKGVGLLHGPVVFDPLLSCWSEQTKSNRLLHRVIHLPHPGTDDLSC